MAPGERRDFFNRYCGVISEHTGKPCRNRLGCRNHSQEDRNEIRDMYLEDHATRRSYDRTEEDPKTDNIKITAKKDYIRTGFLRRGINVRRRGHFFEESIPQEVTSEREIMSYEEATSGDDRRKEESMSEKQATSGDDRRKEESMSEKQTTSGDDRRKKKKNVRKADHIKRR
ncbi:hypothetical protein CEXT_385621 [Caerostris extrusa]|uniref:SCA7 domain-containing protein n=1 Tax=Caerostris extrusa TaxID=172846 RepID=A0AAV4RH88_CAEEX|nr:hypothetical protein CEXT_385621 [Caerostris extrusa]